ncbi:MAG: tripartite tricarboxylate transporter TctB family protein [Betaproteobacteria bacterium]|jgi:putative tricarboxylic transport membrane protein
MIAQHTDRLTGILGIAVSSMYVYQASLIEDSLLADAVGVAGVPTAIGYLMLAASMCLFLKSWWKTKQKAEVSEEETEPGGSEHPHWKALGLLALLAAFVAIVPVLGFVVSIGLFVAAVAYYAGARDAKTLMWCALLTGPMLWLSFDYALEIHLPTGMWSQWIGK